MTANARVPHKYDSSAELFLRKFAHEEDWRRVVMFKRRRKYKNLRPLRGAVRSVSTICMLTKARETGLHLPCTPPDLTRTATECPFSSQNLEDLPIREGVPMGKYVRLGGVVVEAVMPCWLGGGLNHDFPTYPRRRPTLC